MLEVGNSEGKREEFRRDVIAKIGAWSIDNQGRRPDYEEIFPGPIVRLREAFFGDRKIQIKKINEDLLVMMTDGAGRLAPDAAAATESTLAAMKSRFGYCDHCAKDAVVALVRKRYS